MQKIKKTVSILLTLIMVLGLFTIVPVTVGAATSGTDGNITWSFDDETGILTISGTGAMPDYPTGNTPWNDSNISGHLKSIVIEDGITYIGEAAFIEAGKSSGNIITVEFPSTLTEIGTYAFGLSTLKEINLPEGLVSIGTSAFFECPVLDSVSFPSTLQSIGNDAFANCERLESISLPSSLKSIGDGAFLNCNLKDLTLPLSLESVEDYAFHRNSLETVRILGDTEFGTDVFKNNSSQGTKYYFEKARQFDENQFGYFEENDTVFLPSDSTYLYNGETLQVTEQNTQQIFGAAKVIFTPVFKGHSISLNGDIALNYYLAAPENTALHFEWYNKTFDHTITADDFDVASGYYKVKVNVAAAEMNYPITATCTYNGEVLATSTYSVRQYADKILDSESDFSTDYVAKNGAEKYGLLVDLIKKMLDYGAKAQTRFGVTDVALANTGVDYTMHPITADDIITKKTDMTKGLSKLGLTYIGTSVVFLSQTTLRHYYSVTNQNVFDSVKDSASFTYGEKGTRVYFERTDIPAALLDSAQTFGIGESEYNYSVLDYCKLVLSDESKPQSDRELAMATYWYNDAAKAYFYANDEYEDDMV